MNPLDRALIEKTGRDNGFEHVLAAEDDIVSLGSARHRALASITPGPGVYRLIVVSPVASQLPAELARSFPTVPREGDAFVVPKTDEQLAKLLRRTAALAQALPNQAAVDFEAQIKDELATLSSESIKDTEIERLIRQRVGQHVFRQAMLDYWSGACAVTGIALPEVLRASHAKPWAECASDAERLDVFNGFLLCANLDALFDRFLITFGETGELMVSPVITSTERERLGLDRPLKLRWLAKEHQPYLQFHRERFRTNS